MRVNYASEKDKKIDSIQADFPHKIMDIIKSALNDENIKNKVKKDTQNNGTLFGERMIDFNDVFNTPEPSAYLDRYTERNRHERPRPDDGYGGGSRGATIPHISELRSDPALPNKDIGKQVMDLNSPEYINKVRNLMTKLRL
jgi:hypothetical protein